MSASSRGRNTLYLNTKHHYPKCASSIFLIDKASLATEHLILQYILKTGCIRHLRRGLERANLRQTNSGEQHCSQVMRLLLAPLSSSFNSILNSVVSLALEGDLLPSLLSTSNCYNGTDLTATPQEGSCLTLKR